MKRRKVRLAKKGKVSKLVTLSEEELLKKRRILLSKYEQEVEDANPLSLFLEVFYKSRIKKIDEEFKRRGMKIY